MKEFIGNEKKLIASFLKNSKIVVLIIVFFILLTYGIKIFYYGFSIDTEVILNNYDLQMNAWQSIGRIGLVFTKDLFFNGTFNPYIANFLTYITLGVTCVSICYLTERILGNQSSKSLSIIVIPILFLTHPIFAEQFNFILQSFEVSLAILFVLLAALFSYFYIESSYKTFSIPAIILYTWAIVTYQSLIMFYISIAIASFLLIVYVDERNGNNRKFKDYLWISIKYFSIFLVSLILSQVLVKLILKVKGIQSTSYLTDQIIWGKVPLNEVISNIKTAVYNVIFANSIFYNYAFLFGIIMIICLFIYKIFNRNKSLLLEIPAYFLLLVSPFLLTFLMGHSEVFRAQMPAMQFVIGFNFYYIYLYLKPNFIKQLLVLVTFIIAFSQSNTTANLLFSEHVKFEEDVMFANRINEQLDQMGIGDRSNYSLVLLGQHNPSSVAILQGETLGHSFFAWDIGTKQGTTNRAIGFMRILGYLYNYPTEEELDYAHSIENELGVWPEANSIRVKDHLIIVKLSE